MTTKEKAKALREQLKRVLGLTPRAVSVTMDAGSLRVCIKDMMVNIEKVEKIAGQYESIRRDERSGEILCGGNTFVSVSYTYEYTDTMLPLAKTIIAEAAKLSDGVLYPLIDNDQFQVFYDREEQVLRVEEYQKEFYERDGKKIFYTHPRMPIYATGERSLSDQLLTLEARFGKINYGRKQNA